MSKQGKHFFEFDRYRLEATERLLRRDGDPVPLTQRAFDVLLALVERQGQVVSKDELMRQVWADNFVEEGNLTQNIYTLRKALGKAADGDDYIRTIPRRGYCFAVPVSEGWDGDRAKNHKKRSELDAADAADAADVIVVPGDGDSFRESRGDGSQKFPAVRREVAETAPERFEMPAESLREAAAARATEGEPSVGADGKTLFARRSQTLPRALVVAAGIVLLAGLIAAGWWLYRLNQESSVPAMTVTSLTNTGNLQGVAISPDGKYVAYAIADRQEVHSLWLMQLSTYSTRQLIAPSEARYFTLTFPPAGDYIYYVKFSRDVAGRALYRVPLLGGAEKRLIENVETGVSFSPDGKQVVFRRSLNDRREAALILANIDDGSERELTTIPFPETFGDPAWSPDGKTIACAAGRSDGGLNMVVVAVNASDGRREVISQQRWRWIGQMSWLADASGLMMVGGDAPAAPYQIWRLDYPGGTVRRVTNDSNFYNRLSMSADGRAIVAGHRKQMTNLWLVPRADSNRARPITYGAGGVRGRLSWTPDNRIVFDSQLGSATTISVMNADGGGLRQLLGDTTGQAVTVYATASPDGRYIVYASDIAGKRHIWRMNTDGSNPVQLTNGDGEDQPACSPDGRWVIYTRIGVDLPTLWRVSMDGGEPQQLTDACMTFPTVSPDGKMIACFYWDPAAKLPARLALVPIDGGQPVKIFPNRVDGSTLLQWMPDGKGLSYAENLAGVSKVWIQPIAGGEPEEFVQFESDRIFGFSWSPDGEQLACVRGFWSMDAVLVKDFR